MEPSLYSLKKDLIPTENTDRNGRSRTLIMVLYPTEKTEALSLTWRNLQDLRKKISLLPISSWW